MICDVRIDMFADEVEIYHGSYGTQLTFSDEETETGKQVIEIVISDYNAAKIVEGLKKAGVI